MKLVSSLLFIFIFNMSYACEWRDNKPITLYSVLVANHIEKLNLINENKIRAVIEMAANKSWPENIKRLKTGLYIQEKESESLAQGTIFFDQSSTLEKVFKKIENANLVQVISRGMTPPEAIEYAHESVSPFVKNCERRWAALKEKISKSLRNTKLTNDEEYWFFLGNIHEEKRLPQYLMVQDGPVKWLKDNLNLKTYSSPLAYVSWSEKMYLQKKQELVHVALDSANDFEKPTINWDKKNKILKISGKNIMIPGYGQLKLLQEFLKWLKSNP